MCVKSRTLRTLTVACSVLDLVASYRKRGKRESSAYCTAIGIVGGRTVDRIVDLLVRSLYVLDEAV